MANQRSARNTVIGIHAVEALLIHSPEKIQDLFLNQSRQDEKFAKIISLAKLNHISIQKLTDIPEHSQGIVAICRASHHSSSPKFSDLKDILENLTKPALFLILDGVQDPHNLGACIRSGNAAGVDAVIIPKDRAAPLNETAKKAASGAAEFTNVITVTNLSQTIELLKKHNVWVYGLDGSAQKTLFSQDFKHSTAFVMGSEGEGLRRLTREHCDELIAIPMTGEIESLNVSVAAGICLFEVMRQRSP